MARTTSRAMLSGKDAAWSSLADNAQRDDEKDCGDMSIEISWETEAPPCRRSPAAGISVDDLLKRLIDKRAAVAHPAQTIYNDVG
jgi:hypothetical protein